MRHRLRDLPLKDLPAGLWWTMVSKYHRLRCRITIRRIRSLLMKAGL